MGHAKRADLLDLAPLFRKVRRWPEIRETSYGVFYVNRLPFLHFHTKDGCRWADVRRGRSWGSPLPVPMNAPRHARDRFLQRVRVRYRATLKATKA